MTFKNVSLRGPKRTFVVDFVNRNPTGLGTFDNKCVQSPSLFGTFSNVIDSSSAVKISSLIDAFHSPESNGPPPKLEVVNVAGIDQALKTLNKFLHEFDLGFKYKWARRSCATLIHGSHGTGKTFILDQVINTGWAKYVMRIKSDAKADSIKSIFKNAKCNQPSIIVLDELEDLVGKDDAVTKKIVEALEEELDTLSKSHTRQSLPKVLVIAATLDVANIPSSLRRNGRFRKDIPLPIPDATARKAILKYLAPPVHPDSRDEILDRLGDRTHAYTPEDLENLLTEACIIAENKLQPSDYESDDGNYYLAEDDLEQALLEVRPTAMHDINLQPPKVRWDEIGGQDGVKKALRLAVETPLIVSIPLPSNRFYQH
jgi:AAA family ATPase